MTDGAHTGLEHLLYEVKKIVVGQDHFLERVLIALLAGGHLLVEGVPGLAKTLTVSTLAPTWCWPTRSTAPPPRCRARCWK